MIRGIDANSVKIVLTIAAAALDAEIQMTTVAGVMDTDPIYKS